MDCGNKKVTINTNKKMLGFLSESKEVLVSQKITLENSTIIEPCFIAEGVSLTNSTIGPFASIGTNTKIENSNVKNSIIQSYTVIKNATLDEAMIGNHAAFDGNFTNVSIGDYSSLD